MFRAGAHWPLLVFLGNKSRRSPEAIQRREQRAKQRAANARATKQQLGFQQAARLKHGWALQRTQDDQEGEQAGKGQTGKHWEDWIFAQGREAWEDWGHREDWGHGGACGHWGVWGQPSLTWQPSWISGQWHQNAWQ